MSEHANRADHGNQRSPFARRRAGLLLHPTSLPDACLGSQAYRFVDWLAEAGFGVWQTLPLGPTHDDRSPYQCLSVFAGNPDLISIEQVVEEGWLEASSRFGKQGPAEVQDWMGHIYAGFQERAGDEQVAAYGSFKETQAYWLDDYSLYQAIRKEHGCRSWIDWPPPLRDRDPAALEQAGERLSQTVELTRFEQFLFDRQWRALKAYANERDILLFGDMPIFVAYDSAEVWAKRWYFTLTEHGEAETVAGVPPDYFSETGQWWGNPHYRWERMEQDQFQWWRHRIEHQLALFDLLRIDHFRGFEAYWEIPADAETAIEGYWVKAPGDELFSTLRREFDPLPLVAEDLGLITPEVDALRHRYSLPGMKVLQFAFDGGPENPYLPHNHERDYVVYTGTHDNNTTRGWFDGLPYKQQQHVLNYLGAPEESMPWPLIRAALASVAQLAILPLQDVLMLGESHRMNSPGTTEGNWAWQFQWDAVPEGSAERMRELIELYGRDPAG